MQVIERDGPQRLAGETQELPGIPAVGATGVLTALVAYQREPDPPMIYGARRIVT